MSLRIDQQIISDWIPDGVRVLDLGCDNGRLLKHLQQRDIHGYGVEIDNGKFAECIAANINVIQADLDQGLPQFQDQSVDFVILSQTLQAMKNPDFLLQEIVRVGVQAIISFPNFGYWQNRMQLTFSGKMPFSNTLPNPWFNTPNIHLCTIYDFEQLCDDLGLDIVQRSIVNHKHKDTLGTQLLPNLFGQVALYQIQQKMHI